MQEVFKFSQNCICLLRHFILPLYLFCLPNITKSWCIFRNCTTTTTTITFQTRSIRFEVLGTGKLSKKFYFRNEVSCPRVVMHTLEALSFSMETSIFIRVVFQTYTCFTWRYFIIDSTYNNLQLHRILLKSEYRIQ